MQLPRLDSNRHQLADEIRLRCEAHKSIKPALIVEYPANLKGLSQKINPHQCCRCPEVYIEQVVEIVFVANTTGYVADTGEHQHQRYETSERSHRVGRIGYRYQYPSQEKPITGRQKFALPQARQGGQADCCQQGHMQVPARLQIAG